MLSYLINTFVITISMSTMTGILVHDTRIDSAASLMLSVPIVHMAYEASAKLTNVGPDLHTHVERVSAGRLLSEISRAGTQSMPRALHDRKRLMQRHVAKGYQTFESCNLA
jgi:hypothetical protein